MMSEVVESTQNFIDRFMYSLRETTGTKINVIKNVFVIPLSKGYVFGIDLRTGQVDHYFLDDMEKRGYKVDWIHLVNKTIYFKEVQ